MKEKISDYIQLFICLFLFLELIISPLNRLAFEPALIFILTYFAFINIRSYQIENKSIKAFSILIDFLFLFFSLYSQKIFIYSFLILFIFEIYRYLDYKISLLLNLSIYPILFFVKNIKFGENYIYILFYMLINVLILGYFKIANKIAYLEEYNIDLERKNNDLLATVSDIKNKQMNLIDSSRLEERNRISRDLHDSVGHLLSTLAIQLTGLEKISKDKDPNLSQMLGELKDFTKEGLGEVRKIIHDMRPENRDFNWLNDINKLINNSPIKINFISNKQLWLLNERHEQAIYRIIQEFITNSQKYSDSEKINISLIFSEDSLILSLKDFGRGSHTIKEKGGLLSIRERVEELHGRLIIESQRNKGYYLQVYLPRVI